MGDWVASDLTVVIPTRGRWDILRQTLAALKRQTAPGFTSVVVVDGTDQAPPTLEADVVLHVPHGGPGAARNRAVRTITTDLVLFLGDDIVPTPDLVAVHLARHRAEPDRHVAVLG